jgi:hypothetical protein
MRVAAAPSIRPVVLLQFALLVSVVSNLGRIPVFSTKSGSEAPILVNDLAVGLLLLTGALVMARARSLRLDAVALMAMLFALIGGISALAAVPRYGLDTF